MYGDNFMWFPKNIGKESEIKGETNDQSFAARNAFEVLDFNFNMTCEESTGGKGSTSGRGKAKFGSFTITKAIDLASVPLYMVCSQGTIMPTIMLAIRKSGGSPLIYLQYIFRYNQVTSISWKGGSGDKRPEETMTFTFKAMGMQYIPQKADGTQGIAKSWAWNVVDQGATNLDITGIEPPPQFLPGVEK